MNAHRLILAAPLLLAGLLAGCAGGSSSPAIPTETPQLEGHVELLGSMPHEGRAWTEGLLVLSSDAVAVGQEPASYLCAVNS